MWDKTEVAGYLRAKYHAGLLSDEQISRLENIGFDFEGSRRRSAKRKEPLIEFLRNNPNMYTYSELASRFGMSTSQCYSDVYSLGLRPLVKPVREAIDRSKVLSDFDGGLSIAALQAVYGCGDGCIRKILKEGGRTLPKFISDTERREICEMRAHGESIKAISDAIGRNVRTVSKVLKDAGFPAGVRRLSRDETRRAEDMIREGKMTYPEIAEELGTSKSNVARIAKSIGSKSNWNNGAKTVRCLETGEVFPTAKAAQRSVTPNAENGSHVGVACREGKPYKGYHWEYVDNEVDAT